MLIDINILLPNGEHVVVPKEKILNWADDITSTVTAYRWSYSAPPQELHGESLCTPREFCRLRYRDILPARTRT